MYLGIVMKSVGGAPMSVGGSPMKRARLDHSLHEEQDDIEEIPGKLVVLNIVKIWLKPFYHLSKKNVFFNLRF